MPSWYSLTVNPRLPPRSSVSFRESLPPREVSSSIPRLKLARRGGGRRRKEKTRNMRHGTQISSVKASCMMLLVVWVYSVIILICTILKCHMTDWLTDLDSIIVGIVANFNGACAEHTPSGCLIHLLIPELGIVWRSAQGECKAVTI